MQCLPQLTQHALHSKEFLWCYIFPQVQLLFGSAPPFFWRIENFFRFGLMPWLIPASISFLFNKMLPTVAGDKLYFSAIAFLGVCKRLLWLLLLNVKAKAKSCAIVYLTCWSHSRSISALLQVSATGVLVRFSDIVDASEQHEDRSRKTRSPTDSPSLTLARPDPDPLVTNRPDFRPTRPRSFNFHSVSVSSLMYGQEDQNWCCKTFASQENRPQYECAYH